MLKIVKGKIHNSSVLCHELTEECQNDRILIFLDGTENAKKGKAIVLHKGMTAQADMCLPKSYAWFEVEGRLSDEVKEASDIGKLERLVAFLCPDGVFDVGNNDYNSAATALLLTLLPKRSSNTGMPHDYVEMAKRYIDENYSYPISVEKIADEVGTDRKYLRNLFFSRLGVSTKDYLTNVRMDMAKKLLEEGEMSVGEVALNVGYTDPLGFSKMFKKHTGLSPSEYREQNGIENITVTEAKEEIKEQETKKNDIKYFLL